MRTLPVLALASYAQGAVVDPALMAESWLPLIE